MARAMTTTSSMPTPALSAEAHSAVAALFERLIGIFGKPKVAEMWAKADPVLVREQWASGLADLQPQEIDRGIAACRERLFVPNVGEFKRLCRPALDPELAYWEAERGLADRGRGEMGRWSHPAVYRAAVAMAQEVRAANLAACRRRWEWVLGRELEDGWGDGIPEPAKQIEFKEPEVVAAPQAVRRKLAELARKFKESV